MNSWLSDTKYVKNTTVKLVRHTAVNESASQCIETSHSKNTLTLKLLLNMKTTWNWKLYGRHNEMFIKIQSGRKIVQQRMTQIVNEKREHHMQLYIKHENFFFLLKIIANSSHWERGVSMNGPGYRKCPMRNRISWNSKKFKWWKGNFAGEMWQNEWWQCTKSQCGQNDTDSHCGYTVVSMDRHRMANRW